MADVTSIDDAPRRRNPAPEAPVPIEHPAELEPLWREVLGGHLRELRADRDQTLVDTARRAGISPQYLSEIERGLKEPSSEMISAVAGALGTTLAEIATDIGRDLGRRSVAPQRVTLALAA
jgi:DNA-binding XRE family transcriptional regulator